MKIKATPYSNIVALICNFLLAFVVYMVCRVAYVWENWNFFSSGWQSLQLGTLVRGSLRFDTAAIAYTNWLWAILLLLPVMAKEKRWWQTMCKWIFVVVNSLAVAINLCDAVYSQYTGRRTTATFFDEFSNEGNLGTIFFTEVLHHWYLVILALALIAVLWFLYTTPSPYSPSSKSKSRLTSKLKLNYYLTNSIALLILLPLIVFGIRGGLPHKVLRPLAISDANQYVNQPHETAIVLNTPFSIIRTIGKTTYSDPAYFSNDQLEKIYSPLHNNVNFNVNLNKDVDTHNDKNVVVLIVESFGREYIGFYNNVNINENENICPSHSPLNSQVTGHYYKTYTPFVDSLLGLSLTWEQTYANGRKSIDAMPSILSSIPMFVEPFFLTSYSLNRIGGLAYELGKKGYSSAFFHGGSNGTMGFEGFARASKFQNYYGRNEYDEDKRFGGENDYDGTWAIWDEPFLQYYATKMSEMQEPFVTAVFTASSHHPFNIPEQYQGIYKEEEMPIHKCIRYTDNALRKFFATASQQPWFKNTIFVITSDHTNMSNHDEYQTAMGVYSVPIFIYDPSGELPTGVMPGIAQQIDIMPTVLGILGYTNPYIAFGNDLLYNENHNENEKRNGNHWAVNYNNGIYQYLERDTLVQFDGANNVHAFDLHNDPMLKKPYKEAPPSHINRLKAIIQQYMQRMIKDELVIGE